MPKHKVRVKLHSRRQKAGGLGALFPKREEGQPPYLVAVPAAVGRYPESKNLPHKVAHKGAHKSAHKNAHKHAAEVKLLSGRQRVQ
jgi:hypothetical protein